MGHDLNPWRFWGIRDSLQETLHLLSGHIRGGKSTQIRHPPPNHVTQDAAKRLRSSTALPHQEALTWVSV